jgi:phage shock protein A
MDTQEQLDRLTGIVESLAASVVAHDNQIESLVEVAKSHNDRISSHDERIGNLLKAAEKSQGEMAELRRSMAETDRLFQAYLKRLPPQ